MADLVEIGFISSKLCFFTIYSFFFSKKYILVDWNCIKVQEEFLSFHKTYHLTM